MADAICETDYRWTEGTLDPETLRKPKDNPTVGEALVSVTKKFNDAEKRIAELESQLNSERLATAAARQESRVCLGIAADAMRVLKNEIVRREL